MNDFQDMPARAGADVNLLFGILALQMDFISRDQLVAAMNAWVLEKSKPLGDVLNQQGALTEDESRLLSMLVDKHLEKHGGDPQQSLAAATADTLIPEHLHQIEAGNVSATLDQMSKTLHVPSIQANPASSWRNKDVSARRFRKLRLHAAGGLGEVFVAEDIELNREVALKEMHDLPSRDEDSRLRFVLEAEITGGLEHPGIVPVYGLGHYEDGRPYYAMRFIRGKSLKDAVIRSDAREGQTEKSSGPKNGHPESGHDWFQSVEFRKLLGGFIDVCNAIHYAHSRGVLHRDLKPDNIMLGKFGETLVVDWGLARVQGRDEQSQVPGETTLRPLSTSGSTATQHGHAMGTPSYMPPEQAAGRLDDLGPASDVYSLGATLYFLVTGRPPVTGSSVTAVLEKVRRGEFPKPREINPRVPRALDAICLKAMALEPTDRYRTTSELADDIENWLADEPVTARREPPWVRARRWIRRHQTLATSVAVGVVAVLIASAIGLVLLNAANRREQQAKQEALQNFEQAEKNFRRAREAVDDFYVEISEETLLNQPGMQPLRRKLLGQAQQYYETFLEERRGDPNLRRELAAAHFRVGVISEELRTPQQALPSYEQAQLLQEALAAEDPDDLDTRYELSNTVNAIGRSLQKMERLDEALAAYLEALELRQQLADAEAKDHEYQRKLANSHMNIGLIKQLTGDPREAVRRVQLAQEIRHQQLKTHDDINLLRDLGMGYYNLGVFRLQGGSGQQGQDDLKNAVATFKKVLEREPNDLANQHRLATCYRLLADRFVAAGELQQAMDAYEQARSVLEILSMRSPDVAEFQATFATVYMNLADVQRRQNQTNAALDSLTVATQHLYGLARQFPNVPQHRRDYGVALRTIGEIRLGEQDSLEARKYLESAKTVLAQLVAEFPDNRDFAAQLAATDELLQKPND